MLVLHPLQSFFGILCFILSSNRGMIIMVSNSNTQIISVLGLKHQIVFFHFENLALLPILQVKRVHNAFKTEECSFLKNHFSLFSPEKKALLHFNNRKAQPEISFVLYHTNACKMLFHSHHIYLV